MAETHVSESRSRKATNMSFEEMGEMVGILKKQDYDGKHGPYAHPNFVKDKILTDVVKALERKFGVHRKKDQLRKRWSDLKNREPDQYLKIRKELRKSKYLCVPFMILHLPASPCAFLDCYTECS